MEYNTRHPNFVIAGLSWCILMCLSSATFYLNLEVLVGFMPKLGDPVF